MTAAPLFTGPMRPALRYHGGKFRLAPWVISHFPPHSRYVESFGGAAGVLLQKPRCYAEVYNDVDGEIVNFFRVLRDPATRTRLVEACFLTPYSRSEFGLSYEPSDDPVERARRTAVRAAMGFGSAGATKGTTGFRRDTRRSYSTAQQVWASYPESLAAVGERFAGVLIEEQPAIEVMQQQDDVDTLHYVDPPYLPETRYRADGRGTARYYRHEMSVADHAEQLGVVRKLRGMVVLSGYPSDLYDSELKGWSRRHTKARISAGRGTSIRTEVLWLNPACEHALQAMPNRMQPLFAESLL